MAILNIIIIIQQSGQKFKKISTTGPNTQDTENGFDLHFYVWFKTNAVQRLP